MRIIDEATLDLFRGPGRCEHCGHAAHRQPHHVFARGMGSASRLDCPINLLALCPQCHAEAHSGQIPRCSLLALVAARERLLQLEVEEALKVLRNAPKLNPFDATTLTELDRGRAIDHPLAALDRLRERGLLDINDLLTLAGRQAALHLTRKGAKP